MTVQQGSTESGLTERMMEVLGFTAMLKFVHESYGVRGPGKPDEHGFLNWDIMGENYEGKKIATDCVMAHEFEVEMTKEGICSALKYIPCR